MNNNSSSMLINIFAANFFKRNYNEKGLNINVNEAKLLIVGNK